MKTFYCVQTKFFDSGKVKVNTYPIKAEEKPKSTCVENKMCDEYRDYFDSYEEAKVFAKEAEHA